MITVAMLTEKSSPGDTHAIINTAMKLWRNCRLPFVQVGPHLYKFWFFWCIR